MKQRNHLAVIRGGLRILVFPVLIGQILAGRTGYVYLCVLTLMLMELPGWADKRRYLLLPPATELLYLLFVFSSEILGEIRGCYLLFPWWDALLHGCSGFLFASLGAALPELLEGQDMYFGKRSGALFAVCFSLSAGVAWEFLEWGADALFGLDMQKDTVISAIRSVCLRSGQGNGAGEVSGIRDTMLMLRDGGVRMLEGYLDIGLHDTMGDLLADLAGAGIFAVLRGQPGFVRNFVPKVYLREER